jgi:hypothetical protein
VQFVARNFSIAIEESSPDKKCLVVKTLAELPRSAKDYNSNMDNSKTQRQQLLELYKDLRVATCATGWTG